MNQRDIASLFSLVGIVIAVIIALWKAGATIDEIISDWREVKKLKMRFDDYMTIATSILSIVLAFFIWLHLVHQNQ